MAGRLRLRRDPIPPLLAAGEPALTWAVQHDLLDRRVEPGSLWTLPQVERAERSQNADGSWTYHGGTSRIRSREDYAQIATYQQLLLLVSRYRLDKRHPMIERAADNILSHQTPDGDIRGIYGTQYTPNYTGDMLRLLVEAGYDADIRVRQGIDWLLAVRQDDGGWSIPIRTAGDYVYTRAMSLPRPLEPDRGKPSSHLVTGIVLRALAAHPEYRHRPESRRAALWLAGRFFKTDGYVDRRAASYWTKLSFPFRWTDIVSSLDAVGLVGVPSTQPGVARGLRWLVEHQRTSGLWRSGYPNSPDPLLDHWVTFAAARAWKRFTSVPPARSRAR